MSTIQFWSDVFTDSAGISDPRMNRFLMKTPIDLLFVVAFYLGFIYFGSKLMQNRKPFSLRTITILYNVVQIIVNLCLFSKIFDLYSSLNIVCTPWAKSNSVSSHHMIQSHYYYILLKYFDLFDTLFYVLRKKRRQISFLHVSHHIGILVCAWVSGKYFPGGQAIFVGVYNTIIHSIMYGYYLFTCCSPSKNVWWKKYVTVLQIIQHCGIFASMLPVVLNKNCSYPRDLSGLFCCLTAVLIYMFVGFYKQNYSDKNKNV